ncbi:hypothetical protein DFJ63DRAFT_210336 [Scheffersomyces coipomensis]|uniref:uncharacterized protein n=1 Tax=Scheffersomyces coipomensis TaxID=1788519 RepID=UPI00315C8ED2
MFKPISQTSALKTVSQITVHSQSLTTKVATKPNAKIITNSIRSYSILDNAKIAMDKLNKGAGKVAADGLGFAEQATKTAKSGVHEINKKTVETLDTVNKSTGKVLADGMDAVEQAGEKAKAAKDEALLTKDQLEAKKRVREHHKGYKDLQDKGSKTESEQNRPDDAV